MTKTDRRTFLKLTTANHGSHGVLVDVLDKYTGKTTSHTVDVGSTFAAEIAGHLETGDDSITDPAMGGVL